MRFQNNKQFIFETLKIENLGLEEFWKEVELISKLKAHSNIVQFFGICLIAT